MKKETCVKCGKTSEFKKGFCYNCMRCWDCMEEFEECEEYKPSQRTDSTEGGKS